jgi:checkpoint serine/threonine-protein kinase
VPSKHQVIINPQNGKRECIFVNLEAVYPTPNEPGTELSFEEIWASNRGWLQRPWSSEPEPKGNHTTVEEVNQKIAEKLVIHRDPMLLDENGAAKEISRGEKSKKMKVIEVNETQISKFQSS